MFFRHRQQKITEINEHVFVEHLLLTYETIRSVEMLLVQMYYANIYNQHSLEYFKLYRGVYQK